MIAAVLSLTTLGAVLGLILGIANRTLRVEGNPVVEEISAMMPGSNCGQCGLAGCAAAAEAMAAGHAAPTICPPGGKALAQAIAAKLGVALDLSAVADAGPQVALVAEELCIGCCRCAKACPTDAIVGAAKQIHAVMLEACTGCGACLEKCPTDGMVLRPVETGLAQWVMPRPATA